MGSSKIKENHNQEKPKKMKKKKQKTSKQNKEGDQGSPGEKKNVKCQLKEHENVFENNLTGPNEYSKSYQMDRKIHIPDLLPFLESNGSKDQTKHQLECAR